mmetsp:Transcript_16315/g.53137  ORF Transcript_16315/g.53137 Transcript_16315/m.53137 type:complete len:201 (-) Transcript_16315:688-1290(-)
MESMDRGTLGVRAVAARSAIKAAAPRRSLESRRSSVGASSSLMVSRRLFFFPLSLLPGLLHLRQVGDVVRRDQGRRERQLGSLQEARGIVQGAHLLDGFREVVLHQTVALRLVLEASAALVEVPLVGFVFVDSLRFEVGRVALLFLGHLPRPLLFVGRIVEARRGDHLKGNFRAVVDLIPFSLDPSLLVRAESRVDTRGL